MAQQGGLGGGAPDRLGDALADRRDPETARSGATRAGSTTGSRRRSSSTPTRSSGGRAARRGAARAHRLRAGPGARDSPSPSARRSGPRGRDAARRRARPPPRPGRRGRLLRPGGRYPMLASSFMTVVVPKVAGVERVVACAPPRAGGGIHPPMLYAMAPRAPTRSSASAACRRSRRSPSGSRASPVDMIVGAGNAYVAEAKRQLFGEVGIDLLAGPDRDRSSSPTRPPTRSSSPPTCSARPSTGRRRRRS